MKSIDQLKNEHEGIKIIFRVHFFIRWAVRS